MTNLKLLDLRDCEASISLPASIQNLSDLLVLEPDHPISSDSEWGDNSEMSEDDSRASEDLSEKSSEYMDTESDNDFE